MIRVLIFLMALASFAPLHAQNTGKEPPKKFSPEELKKAVDDFVKKFDLNKDGFLSQDELPKFVPGAVGRLDRNGDGKLTRDELGPPPGRGPDGRPGEPGRPATGAPEGRPNPEEFVRRLKDADKNNDGKISKDEAPDRIKEMFDRIDGNGDGFLDEAEIKQVIQRLLGRRPE